MDREEAVKQIEQELERLIPRAIETDKSLGKWHLAFPKGFTPKLDEHGAIVEIVGIAPEVDEDKARALIECAQKGDRLAFEALLAWAGWYLSNRDEIPSKAVRSFLANYLCGFFEAPKSPRSRPPAASHHQMQYAIVSWAVWKVVDWGFARTGSTEDEILNSACGIVADAMKRLSLRPASYERIQDIVTARLKLGIK